VWEELSVMDVQAEEHLVPEELHSSCPGSSGICIPWELIGNAESQVYRVRICIIQVSG
jgi:hypothetical protein